MSLPPTHRQTRWAIAVGVCQVAALTLLAPFAKTQLAHINAFIPAFEGVIFATDLVTSVLLFSQFAIYRLRALLVLACGYLFSALMIIPHALTFPGAFSPTGLLGAGLQTTASLYWFWHLLFPMALLGYGLMRDEKSDPGPAEPSLLALIVGSVALVLALVCGLTLLATAGNNYLPVLFADSVDFTPAARAAGASTMLLSASAVAVLWRRRRSLLDQWLMIVALAAILEMALGAIFVSGRFSLGFYAGRLFSLLTSTIVLVVLLAETTRLYANVARSQEGKIRRLVDANIIGICVWDVEGRILEANDAFLRVIGYDREDVVAGCLRWTDLTPPEWLDRDERRWLPELKVTGSLQPFEKEYFRKDGSRVPVLIGVATFEEGGNQGVAFVLDLTERKRVEERLRVEHSVAQILAEDATIQEATQRILRAMGECLGWDVGVLWRVDREAEALRCVELWHKASIEVPEFERVSRAFTFGPGLGLPGRVWSSLEPEYIPDVVFDENFPRAPIAEREGLRAAFGFPILLGGEVLGVIEFFSREIRQPDQELLNVLATIGSQIGQFIERKRGEEALRESEARFRDFAETASDWFCEMGPDYKFTLLSENAFGSGAADRIGTACWDHALDLETEPEKWRQLQETVFSRKPFRDFVYRGMSSDGSPMYVRASGKPLFDANGDFRGYRGTCSDVTEITRAQEALRESERSARSAIDGIAGLLLILAPNGEVETVNRQVFEYFGRSLEELKNWGTSGAVYPEDLPRVLELFKRAIASGIPFNYELRLRRFDGEYRWFDTRHVPIRDGSGCVVRWYVLATDIEDRTRAEAALRNSEEVLRRREKELRDILETIPAMTVTVLPDGSDVFIGKQFVEYSGLSADKARRSGWKATIHPDDMDQHVSKWRASLASGEPIEIESRFRRADGEYRWFLARAMPLRDDGGNILNWYEVLTDIEDRTRALARLEQMQSDFAHMNRVSMMGELAASLSHEITQPIAAARNYARAALNFLDHQPPDLGEVKKQLGRVVGAADRSGEIIERIRDHIKKAPPRKAHFDLNHAIEEVIVLARSAITKNGVSVQTLLSKELAPVQGDRVQLQQVVMNLILNAVEAMGAVKAGPRELLISTEEHRAKGVLVAVRDSGPGLDPENLERVFESFYTTKASGTGMGLSICRSIIVAHGGRLWAGVNEPRGAVFQFTLPSAENNS